MASDRGPTNDSDPGTDFSFDLRDYIKVYDGTLSRELCRTIVREYDDSDEWTQNRYGHIRAAETIDVCTEDSLAKTSRRYELIAQLQEAARACLCDYIRTFYFYEPINLVDRGFELLRYQSGAGCYPHVDCHSYGSKTGQYMLLSMLIMLNDDYDGGQFSFWQGKHPIAAKTGSLLIFPATPNYLHGAAPVLSGTRYVLVDWFDPARPAELARSQTTTRRFHVWAGVQRRMQERFGAGAKFLRDPEVSWQVGSLAEESKTFCLTIASGNRQTATLEFDRHYYEVLTRLASRDEPVPMIELIAYGEHLNEKEFEFLLNTLLDYGAIRVQKAPATLFAKLAGKA